MSNDEPGSGNPPLNAGEFLRQVLGELGSKVGAMWIGESGQLIPVVAVGLEESGLFSGPNGKQFLQQVLSDAINQGRAQTFDTEGLIEPTAFGHATLFVVPMLISSTQPGVILVAERPNLPQQQRIGMMRHVELRCRELTNQIAKAIVPNRGPVPDAAVAPVAGPSVPPTFGPARNTAAPQISGPQLAASQSPMATRPHVDPQAVLDYLLSLQRSLDLNEVANVVVNDGRILFGVDRVSLAMRRGRKAIITAVSGQESVHPRGNLIRAMGRLTQKVLTSGEPFRYDGSIANVPKELEEPLAEFIQEAGTRFLMIVPLLEPERLVKPEEPMGGGKPQTIDRQPIGALIVEQMSNSEPSTQLKGTLDSVVDHIAAAAYNSHSHSTIFLLPVWRSMGRFFEWLRGRRLAIAGAIAAALVAAGAALVLVPWDYRVDGTGRLMPVTQREVFAPWDGQVMELLVEGGQHVEKDQPLIKLRNDELNAELVKVESELQEKQKLLHSLKAQADEAERQGKKDDKLKANGKAMETQVEIEGGKLQQEILQERQKRLTVRAPIAGIVTTFQVQQLLENRPVKRGDLLLQVMDEKGDWQLELEIAEHRVGRILKAQKELGEKARKELGENAWKELGEKAQKELGEHLPIEYRLLTSPESSYEATLKMLATRTVTAEEDGSVLEARATLDTEKLPSRAIGADVRARIGCGKSNLGDVLFGDVVEFIQRYLWW